MADQSFILRREYPFCASNHGKQKQTPVKRLSYQLLEKNHRRHRRIRRNRSDNIVYVTMGSSSHTPSMETISVKRSNKQSFSSYHDQVRLKNAFITPDAIIRPKSLFISKTHQIDNWQQETDSILPIDNHSKKKKRCSPRYIFISVTGVIILIGAIIAAILIPLLTRTKTTTVATRNMKKCFIAPAGILRWNPAGITIAGITSSPGTASNKLNLPWDLTLDWLNTLYITDRANNRVQKYLYGSSNGLTIAGQINGTAGKSSIAFNQTSGIALDLFGNLYVADMLNHRVQFFVKNSFSGVTIAGNGTAGSSINQLNMPHCLEYDLKSSTLYVTDTYNHRIKRYLLSNSSCTVVAGGNGPGITKTKLSSPHAVFYDLLSNSLLIANFGANNIVRWVLGANNWTLVAGSNSGTAGTTSTLLNGPTDIMLDPMGNMYVADRSNHRIQFFLFGQSNATTIAGVTARSGNNSTMLNYPNSIALDTQLNLYVVDHYNHRIQKFLRY